METIFIYLIKSSALIDMFFLVHHFLLRKETFFTTNRWFLLSGLFISAVAPLLFIKKIVYVEPVSVNVEELVASSQTMSNVPQKTAEILEINWFEIGFWIYGIIVLLLLLKVMYNSFSLYKTLKNKPILKQEPFLFVDVEDDVAPFSFFNFIVYNSKLYSESELNSILTHEKIHSAQKHSIDVLITKLFSIVFWFNPFMQWYKKAIVQNLEYIADQKAIECIQDKKSYQLTLLKVVSHQNCLPITNHFYQSLIKKRIVMLNTNQSHKRNAWKYAVVVPALIAFVLLFQIKIIAQEKSKLPQNSATIDSVNAIAIGFRIDKNATNEEMKNDSEELKKRGIDYKFSKIKRNDKGEITAIKVEFDDHKGNKGSKEVNDKKPIEPIYFSIENNEIGFKKTFNDEDYIVDEKLSEKFGTEIKVKKIALTTDPPIAPTPPTPPVINIPNVPFPNMPVPPTSPSGTPLNNKKQWEKFEKSMEEFEKKMEALEPQMEAYAEKMANIDEQMKPFEKEMEVFEKKMEVFEKEMEAYMKKIESAKNIE